MWGSRELVGVDGHPLGLVRAGSGPPLLLINGIGASVEMWAPFAASLGGNELIAFDMPGTGSSPPAARPLRVRGLAALTARLLDQIGIDRIDVLGYSFGGSVAQELARRAPARVRRLVLCSTSSGVGSLPPNPLAALLMLTPARYQSVSSAKLILPVIAGGRTRRDAGVLQATLADRLANPPTARGYLHQLYAISGWTSSPWLRRLRQRTLILHGDDDPLVPVANARHMARTMPHARLLVVNGGGHLLLLDEPGAVTDELTAFLAR